MPDWGQHIRPRLSALRLSPAREAEIVDELSQHLEERWREWLAGGASETEATRLALAEFQDSDRLRASMALTQGDLKSGRPAAMLRSPLLVAALTSVHGRVGGSVDALNQSSP